MINAVFNHRQFWDGRAEERVQRRQSSRQARSATRRCCAPTIRDSPSRCASRLVNSSLASQAVAPIVSDAGNGGARPNRSQDVGRDLARTSRKMFKRIQNVRPLAQAAGPSGRQRARRLSRWPQPGLTARELRRDDQSARSIERWWHSSRLIRVSADGSKARRRSRGQRSGHRGIHADSVQLHACSSASPCRSTRRRSSPTTRRGTASVARIRLRPIRT